MALAFSWADVLIETGADGFVFENVAALLSKRNKPILDKMIEELQSAGFQTRVVKRFASEFGVAQHRERVFVLGSRASEPAAPSLGELRNSVTSKGGTTAAGLGALNADGGLSKRLHDTLQAAYDRAVELR